VQIWLDHLHEVQRNQQRGAVKAAETRRAKQAAKEQAKSQATQLQSTDTSSTTSRSGEDNVCCGVCGGSYEEVTEDVEDWIGCDNCET